MSLRRVGFVSSTAVLASVGLVVALGAGAACTHDKDPEVAVIDAPQPDVDLTSDAQQLPVTVLVNGEDVPADLSCLGESRPDAGPISPPDAGEDAGVESDATTPSDGGTPVGTLVEKQIELIGFGTGGADKLGNQTIDVFYSNTFGGPPSATVTSDAAGLFKVAVPHGLRVAYHVRNSTLLGDYYTLDDLHEPLVISSDAAPPPIRWQGVTRERQEILALAITGQKGYEIKTGTGIVAGRVVDCKRRYMQHARVELVDYEDPARPQPVAFTKCGTGLCRVFLSDAELPDVGRQMTSRAGLFAMIDMPVGRKLRLMAYGLVGSDPNTLVAWRNVEVQSGGITTHFVEPNAAKPTGAAF